MRDSINRPAFPSRAVITAGMPYGNKSLHLGHIGGVFIHADIYRRFMEDRLGKENVIFVSGTDCYGSPIVEYHRRAVEQGEFTGSLEEFVLFNHENQKKALKAYGVSTESFFTSAFGRAGEVHKEMSHDVLKKLYNSGLLKKLSTPQFYDSKVEKFLNGRQVIGKCPVPGCKSEKGYADECDMGHPYEPKDLINPVSTLSGEVPEMKEVTNWYIDLQEYRKALIEWADKLDKTPGIRKNTVSSIKEFLEPPTLHVMNEYVEVYTPLLKDLPPHSFEEGKKSSAFIFNTLEEREAAGEVLNSHGVRFRAGKTLTPFRLTGNIKWSLEAPELEELKELTFWVWPESLWAPVSFTKTHLEEADKSEKDWKSWWSSEDAGVYQFIGEDNVFFYSLAQMSLFMGLNTPEGDKESSMGPLQPTNIIANCHLLQGNKKASSSGEIKPIMALDLLNHYTPDQLRAHFFALGLGKKPLSFNPKPFNSEAKEKDADPVLKEGNLLCNVLNRICRSGFYTAQKYFDGVLPYGEVSKEILKEAETVILAWERSIHTTQFHKAMSQIEKYIRGISKFWANNVTKDSGKEELHQVLVDIFHMIRTAVFLLHPVAPEGSEMVKEYLNVGDDFFSWNHAFETLYFFTENKENHKLKFLEPRVDFFPKHSSQY